MSDDRAPQRIVVIGNTASGKSTLSARLAVRFDLVHLELDSFAHGPGWQLASPQQFRGALQPRTGGERWVCDGNYFSRTTEWLWPQADTVIWLDLPLWRILPRLVARSNGATTVRITSPRQLHRWWQALPPAAAG